MNEKVIPTAENNTENYGKVYPYNEGTYENEKNEAILAQKKATGEMSYHLIKSGYPSFKASYLEFMRAEIKSDELEAGKYQAQKYFNQARTHDLGIRDKTSEIEKLEKDNTNEKHVPRYTTLERHLKSSPHSKKLYTPKELVLKYTKDIEYHGEKEREDEKHDKRLRLYAEEELFGVLIAAMQSKDRDTVHQIGKISSSFVEAEKFTAAIKRFELENVKKHKFIRGFWAV